MRIQGPLQSADLNPVTKHKTPIGNSAALPVDQQLALQDYSVPETSTQNKAGVH